MEFRFKTCSTESEWNQQNHMHQNYDITIGTILSLNNWKHVEVALTSSFSQLQVGQKKHIMIFSGQIHFPFYDSGHAISNIP